MRITDLRKKTIRLLDRFILLGVGIYLMLLALDHTLFWIPLPSGLRHRIFIYLLVLAGGKFLISIRNLQDVKGWVLPIALGVMFALIYRSDQYEFLLFCGILPIGLKGIDYRRILRIYLITVSWIIICAVISGMAGTITNLVYPLKGFVRSALGIAYPTDFASNLLFLYMIWMVYLEKVPMGLAGFGSLVLAGGIWYLTRSETSCICSVTFSLLCFGYLLLERTGEKGKKLRKGIGFLLSFSFPLFAGLMFGLVFCYAKGVGFAYRVNDLLSGRLKLALDAFRLHGLSLFGTPFAQIGGGGSTFANAGYNFVDSTYPLILLRYGIVMLIVYAIIWCFLTGRAFRNRKYMLGIVLSVIALHSFSEHHFPEIIYNIFLVLPFCDFSAENDWKERNWKEYAVLFGYAFVCVCILLMLMPTALSVFRTIMQVSGHGAGGANQKVNIFIITVGLLLLFTVTASGYYWIRNRSKKYAVLCLGTILLSFSGFYMGKLWIEKIAYKYQERIEADAAVLQIAIAAAEGKVYVEEVPEVYRLTFPEIDQAIFAGDDLVRTPTATILTDRGNDSNVLIKNGYLHTEVSEWHSLYTNDEAVIEALKDAGYILRGYYATRHTLDLKWSAKKNNLLLEDGIQMDGSEHSITYGPNVNLYSGDYTVEYKLRLEEEVAEDEEIATLRVSAYNGKEIIKEEMITGSDFQEGDSINIGIPFRVSDDYKGIEFLIFMKDGKKLALEDMQWYKSPSYDIRYTYNWKYKPTSERYYDLDGEKTLHSDGYHFKTTSYDKYDNPAVVHYYGLNEEPVLIRSGYAEVHREYDEEKRVIREEYYDTEGNLMMLANGYAANEREYDNNNNAIVQRYYDTENQAVLTTWGYAEVHREYDDQKRVVREEYYDIEGNLMTLPNGYAANEREYDNNNNAVVQRYYDMENQAVFTTWGYAEVHREYDDQKRVIREEYYDTEGNLMMLSNGYAANEREYDADNNAIVQRYYDTEDQTVLTTWGYAEVHREYDDQKRVIREEYYDTEGNQMMLSNGYAANEREYDADNNAIVQRYYDTENQAVLITWGYAEVHREYDDEKRVVWEEYYDTEGNPVSIGDGYYAKTVSYDKDGNREEQKIYEIQDVR